MSDFDEAAYWSDRHASGKRSGQQLPREHEFICQEVTRVAQGHTSIIDFGCGDGALAAKYLQLLEQDWTGLDISPKAIGVVRTRGIGTAEVADFTKPLEHDADLAVCFNVLYHLPTEEKVRQVLANMASARTAMIVTWNESVLGGGPLSKHCFLWPRWVPPGHVVITEKVLPGSPHKVLLITQQAE